MQAILDDLAEIDRWAGANTGEVAALLGPRMGIPAEVLQVALDRMGYGVQPLDDAVVAEQQRIADTFHGLGLLPADQRPRRGLEGRVVSHAGSRRRPLVPAHPRRRPLSRHDAWRARGRLPYLRQIAQAADELGYFGVLLPTGRSCEDSWVVASMAP